MLFCKFLWIVVGDGQEKVACNRLLAVVKVRRSPLFHTSMTSM
jgi:hypothetical protein